MAYPATKDTFTDPSGTSLLTQDPPTGGHAGLHTAINNTMEALQDTVGTTAGTNVLKSFAAGDFPARINSSNVLQQIITGTVNTTIGTLSGAVIGTPVITGGTVANSLVGTSQLTGGTINPTSSLIGGLAFSHIMQTYISSSLGSVGATNQDVLTHWGQGSITPKSASSTIYVFLAATGLRCGATGRLDIYTVHGTTSGSTDGTVINGTANISLLQNQDTTTSNATIIGSFAPGSTAQRFVKALAIKHDSSTAWSAGGFGSDTRMFLAEVL